ncbi:MAG: hypothetical protein U0R19_03735 [Bryobacteraceae bacterium]
MPTPAQLSDLTRLQLIAEQFAADIAIIGAAALQCFIDLPRFTNDIDLVVALDLEPFSRFQEVLRKDGWLQEERREHRWCGPSGSMVDILPAGPALRVARAVVWPESEFAMSLVGFEHVFTRAVEVELGTSIRFRVAPPPVIALLKIIAFMEDQQRRRKDLDDLRILFSTYEASSDRIFSDEVFAANLEDIGDASAFLLGMDIRVFASNDEAAIVRHFLDSLHVPSEELSNLDRDDFRHKDALPLHQQLRAFSLGLRQSRHTP